MAYNDHTVAINPDGDGNSVFYSDSNPTINGQYIGGGYTFGADAARDGHVTAQIVYGRHHVASLNGYYIMTETNRMFDTSDTFTTLNVIDGNGSISNHITTTGTILRGKDSGGTAINYITKTTAGGGLRFGADDSVILGAGEMGLTIQNNISSLADEAVHIGGESGVYFYSSPDNLTSNWAGRHSMRFNESGRFGIRTESPTSTLHILGENDNQVKIDVAAGCSFSSLSFARGGTNVAVVAYNHTINQFQLYSNCTCSYISMYTGGAERATLTKEGKFGIGKTTPTHPLHIYDAGNSVYARWERSTGNMYIGSDSIGGAIGTTGNIPLYFYTGDGTERMRLTCQGNFGIGQCNGPPEKDSPTLFL